jgi:peptidoglycan/xylan/chitin deacetylase (PgdA/CDA1 family)
VSLEEIARLPSGADAIAITFDDGFVNFGTIAWPLLKEHNLPATLFVVSEHVGKKNTWKAPQFPDVPQMSLLDWRALGRMAQSGLSIGSHTRHHPDLRSLSDEELVDEIEGAATRIETETGVRPVTFSYPFGCYNERVVAAVRAAHSLACTTKLRALGRREDPLRLPRLDAYYFQRPGQLEGWGTLAFHRYLWVRANGRRLRHALALTGVRW